MRNCRFDVSPVNYPDPDPDAEFTSVDEFMSLLKYLRRTLIILVYKIRLRYFLCL